MFGSIQKKLISPLKEAVSRWQADDGSILAAAVAYYAALSVFPLLLVLMAGLGLFLDTTTSGQDAQQQVVDAIEQRTSAQLADNVRAALEQVQDKAAIGGPLGLLGLLLGALAIFAQFERAFNRIWNTPDPAAAGFVSGVKNLLVNRLKAFCMLVALGCALLLVFLAGVALGAVQTYTQDVLPYSDSVYWGLQIAVSVLLNTLVLAAIYKWLPQAPVRWSEALRGGLLAAAIWEMGRLVLNWFVIGDKFSSAYGLIGAFIALLLWVYYAAAVIFLGAEFVQTICRECEEQDSSPASPRVAPKSQSPSGA